MNTDLGDLFFVIKKLIVKWNCVLLLVIFLIIVDDFIQFTNVKSFWNEPVTLTKIPGPCVLISYLHSEVGGEPSPV